VRGLRLLLRAYFLLFLVLPAVAVLGATFSHLSAKLLTERVYLEALFRSLLIASLTTLLATLFGTACGVFVSRLILPGRNLWLILHTLPLFFVPYQFALAWSVLLPAGFSKLLFSPLGVVFVLTGCFYPLVFWAAVVALSSIPPEEEESALLVAPPREVFLRLTLRRIRPYVWGASLLIFLFAFSEVGVPTYLGVNVLPGEILTRFAAFYDLPGAMAASFPVVLLSLILFLAEKRVFSRLRFQERPAERVIVFRAEGWRRVSVVLFLASVAVLFLLVPVGVLIYEASDLKSLHLALSRGTESLLHSLLYALTAASLAAGWSLLSLHFLGRRERDLISWVTLLDFFLPSVVMAVGLIFLWGRLSAAVYGTALLLLAGLLARFSFLPYQGLSLAYERLDPSGIEAAQLSGAGELRVLARIVYPQLRRWFYLGLMLAFVFSMNELGLGAMLYPPGGEPLVVRLYTLSVNNPVGVSAALALLNSLGTLVLVTFFLRRGLARA